MKKLGKEKKHADAVQPKKTRAGGVFSSKNSCFLFDLMKNIPSLKNEHSSAERYYFLN
jgi:hypothetical protein